MVRDRWTLFLCSRRSFTTIILPQFCCGSALLINSINASMPAVVYGMCTIGKMKSPYFAAHVDVLRSIHSLIAQKTGEMGSDVHVNDNNSQSVWLFNIDYIQPASFSHECIF
jgi:hypothetical protein